MSNPGRPIVALLLFLAMTISTAVRADWMNLTGAETAPNIAEITVLDDRVRVALEIYVGNLEAFEALLPDDWLKTGAAEIAKFKGRKAPLGIDAAVHF